LQHVLIKLSFKSYDVVAHYVHRRLEKLCPCATFLPWTSSSNIGLSSILTYDTMSVGMQLQFHSNMTAASTGTDDHRSTGAQEHRSTGAQEHRSTRPHLPIPFLDIAIKGGNILPLHWSDASLHPTRPNPAMLYAVLGHHVTNHGIKVSWSAYRGDGHQNTTRLIGSGKDKE
jgi:hypothetical protein